MSIEKITNDVPKFQSLSELKQVLGSRGCQRCELGFQKEINGVCVSRGNLNSKIVIVGEAPGKHEDSQSQPFVGPAGKLLDAIMRSVDLDTNRDMYLTNVAKCRPYSPKGSGKENYTPKADQLKQCKTYLDQEFDLIKPKVVILLGKIAVDNVLPELKKESMASLRGRVIDKQGTKYMIFYHPAAILHASWDPVKEQEMKEQTWEDAKKLKKLIEEINVG